MKNTQTAPFSDTTAGSALKPCTYLLVNLLNGAIYTGATCSLVEQVWKHKNQMIEGFSKKYKIDSLVWYEEHDTIEAAYTRAKFLKASPFEVKQAIVKEGNPEWLDLYSELCEKQQNTPLKSA